MLFFSLSVNPLVSIINTYAYQAPNMDIILNMKKTLLGPIFLSSIRMGVTRHNSKAEPHRVRILIPTATSTLVSAAYIQASGPLVLL